MTAKVKKVTVVHASFWYAKRYPGEDIDRTAVALRGEEIEVGKEDYDRGQRFGAFATDEAQAAAAAPAAEPAADPAEPVEVDLSQSVDEILQAVGDDPVTAAAVIDRENAAEKPRKTLLEPLQALVDAAAADPAEPS